MRISLLLLFLVPFTQTVAAAAKIEHWQSSQGSDVYYVHSDALPLADIRVIFDAGSARDGKQHGIASFTSAMLDTGAGKWDADALARRFESVGARFGRGASRDNASLSLRSLTDEKLFDKALQTLQVILQDPKFNEADFQRKKARILAGLKRREASPGALASIAFYKAIYGKHPYAHPVSGFIDTIEPLQVEDLRAFYRRYYVAANAMVVIVGDFTRQQAEQVAEKILAGLPKGEKPQPLPVVTMPEKGGYRHIDFPSKQTHVLSGMPVLQRDDPDYFALYLGNHILGGSGLVSKMFKEIREKRGLAYSTYSYFSPLLRKGPFVMGLQTSNDQTREAVSLLNKTLQDFIQQGPSEEELVAAKKNITGGFVMNYDTNSELTNYVAMIGFYKKPLDYLDTFQQRIEAVSSEDIKDAFQRRVNPGLLQTITVGDGSDLGETPKKQ